MCFHFSLFTFHLIIWGAKLQISDKEYVFSARLEVDYLNEKYKLSLPESENYETLGGLVVAIHESIPSKNEEVSIENYRFLVEEVADNKVITVRIFVSEKWIIPLAPEGGTSEEWREKSEASEYLELGMWVKSEKWKVKREKWREKSDCIF